MSKTLALTLATLLLAACGATPASTTGGDADPASEKDDEDADEEETVGVYPKEVFTGYDGARAFVVPVSSIGGKATWTVKDSSLVSLEESSKGVKITTKKAGSTTLTAKIGDRSFTVKVNVAEYSADAWEKGKNAYTKTVMCTGCHVSASGTSDHSPSEIGRHADAHLEKRILTGESLQGEAKQADHEFAADLGEGDLEGLIAYLRALEPEGWPQEPQAL